MQSKAAQSRKIDSLQKQVKQMQNKQSTNNNNDDENTESSSMDNVGVTGPKGEKGERGEKGADGHDGHNGKDGKIGPRGLKGNPGPDLTNLKEEVKELKAIVSKDENQIKQMHDTINKKIEQYTSNITDEVQSAVRSNVDDPKLKQQLVNRKRMGKETKIQRIGSVMKTKSKDNKLHKNTTTCTGGSTWTSIKLTRKKKLFCKGSDRLDLSN